MSGYEQRGVRKKLGFLIIANFKEAILELYKCYIEYIPLVVHNSSTVA